MMVPGTGDLGIADQIAREAAIAITTLWDPWSKVSDPVWVRTGRLGTAVLEAVVELANRTQFEHPIEAALSRLRAEPCSLADRDHFTHILRNLLAQSTTSAIVLHEAVSTFMVRNRIVQQTGSLYSPQTPHDVVDLTPRLKRARENRRGINGTWLCTVVVDFRARDQLRRRNVIASICSVLDQEMMRSEYRVVVVEQDELGIHRELFEESVDHYVHASNKGPYNRSWAHNVGAAATNGAEQFLLFLDADVLLQRGFLKECLDFLQISKHQVLIPNASLTYLDDLSSNRAIADRFLTPHRTVDFRACHGYRLLTNRGGCVFIDSREFHRAGGYDERYEGWGDEDNEFYEHMSARGPIGQLAHDPIHLHHARARAQTADGTRPNERLVGTERESNLAIGDVNRFLSRASDEYQENLDA